MRPLHVWSTLAALAAALLVTTAAPGAAPRAGAAASCHNLAVTPELRATLTQAHARTREGAISRGSLYYGRCGETRYAIASFSKALADQPEKFRKLPGKAWKDMGDGFEDGCDAGARWPIPKPLVRIWGTCRR